MTEDLGYTQIKKGNYIRVDTTSNNNKNYFNQQRNNIYQQLIVHKTYGEAVRSNGCEIRTHCALKKKHMSTGI